MNILQAAMATQRRPGPLSELSVDQVAAWAALTPLPLEVAQILRDHAISGDILETLSNEDMISMGIRKLGWRRELELCRRELVDQFRTRQALNIQSDLSKPSADGASFEKGGSRSASVDSEAAVVQHGMECVTNLLKITQMLMETTETRAETSEETSPDSPDMRKEIAEQFKQKLTQSVPISATSASALSTPDASPVQGTRGVIEIDAITTHGQGPTATAQGKELKDKGQGIEPKAKAKGFSQSRPGSATRATSQSRPESGRYFVPAATAPVAQGGRSPSSLNRELAPVAKDIPIQGFSAAGIPAVIAPVVQGGHSPSSLNREITPLAHDSRLRGGSVARASSPKHEINTPCIRPLVARARDSPPQNLQDAVRSPSPATPEKSRASRDASRSPGASKIAVLKNAATTIATKSPSATPNLPQAAHAELDASRSPEAANRPVVRSCAKVAVSRSRTATPDVPRTGNLTANSLELSAISSSTADDGVEIFTPKPRPGTPGTPNLPRVAQDCATIIAPRLGSATHSLPRASQDGATFIEPRPLPCTPESPRTVHDRAALISPGLHLRVAELPRAVQNRGTFLTPRSHNVACAAFRSGIRSNVGYWPGANNGDTAKNFT